MNDLLNNWLFQAIFGNVVCYLLSKLVKSFLKWIKSSSSETTTSSSFPKYPKKLLKKQFYISLSFTITGIPLFFLTNNQFLKCVSFLMMFLGIILFDFAFECALDSFDDVISNRCKNNS